MLLYKGLCGNKHPANVSPYHHTQPKLFFLGGAQPLVKSEVLAASVHTAIIHLVWFHYKIGCNFSISYFRSECKIILRFSWHYFKYFIIHKITKKNLKCLSPQKFLSLQPFYLHHSHPVYKEISYKFCKKIEQEIIVENRSLQNLEVIFRYRKSKFI